VTNITEALIWCTIKFESAVYVELGSLLICCVTVLVWLVFYDYWCMNVTVEVGFSAY